MIFDDMIENYIPRSAANPNSFRALYVFNPEHDIALAANRERFTPPRAGRQLRHDLGFIPAMWSQAGALVLVDDKAAAVHAWQYLQDRFQTEPAAQFVTWAELGQLASGTERWEIRPWGWDCALRRQLLEAGIPAQCLPADRELAEIRAVSNRRWAARQLLPEMVSGDPALVGEARYCTDMDAVRAEAERLGRCLCKSPWSSSGRGLRLLDSSGMSVQTEGWIAHVIRQQGGIMVEPYYRKVRDFGMEFWVTPGRVEFAGLSLFSTLHGAYQGSILAAESDKVSALSELVAPALLDRIRERMTGLLQRELRQTYRGPLGIDLMIVSDWDDRNRLRVHPCVELNLRMTMGHVALAVNQVLPETRGWMRITYDGSYHLQLIND